MASLLLLLLPLVQEPAAYHVDAEAGDDAKAGTEPSTAWKSVDRVNAAQKQLRAGDRVLFRRGRVFRGGLVLLASGTPQAPLVYGAYGEGPPPEITGWIAPSDWKALGGGVWEGRLPAGAPAVQAVAVDGAPRPLGRWPNEGWLTIDSHSGKASIADADLPPDPDWTGAELVFRSYRWVIDRAPIKRHDGRSIHYSFVSAYEPVDGHGYFIQNHPATLDAYGEWWADAKAGVLRVHLGASDPERAGVRATAVDVLVQASGRRHLVFENLALTGANRAALRLDDAEHVAVRGCTIRGSGVDAIRGSRAKGIVVEDAVVEATANNAIHLDFGATGCAVRRTAIRNTAMVPGMGASGDGTYNAIVLLGGDNVVEDCEITDTGYLPVHFSGPRATVRRNSIRGFASVKDDAGGIYTWTGVHDKTPTPGRLIEDNVILDGKGAPGGALGDTKAFGIYLDDCASGVEVRRNTVARSDAGLFLHNARHCRISGNTFFDNRDQLLIIHDDIGPEGAIREIEFVDNLLVARTPAQRVLSAQSVSDDFAKFGTFERNVYARPADPGLVVRHAVRDGRPRAYDLEGRRAVTGLDRTTRPSAVRLRPWTAVETGPNLVRNGDFEAGLQGASFWSGPKNAEISRVEGKLDGACLEHRFTKPSGSAGTSLLTLEAGGLKGGKRYRLRFAILGTAEHGSAAVRLRDGESPWGPLTSEQDVKLDPVRREHSLLFTAPADRTASAVEWAFNESDGTFWLDGVSLREAVVEPGPETFLFEANASSKPRTVPLQGDWVDVDGKPHAGDLVLPPWNSRLLIRADAVLK